MPRTPPLLRPDGVYVCSVNVVATLLISIAALGLPPTITARGSGFGFRPCQGNFGVVTCCTQDVLHLEEGDALFPDGVDVSMCEKLYVSFPERDLGDAGTVAIVEKLKQIANNVSAFLFAQFKG
jgi:hypothetical protein